MKLQRDSILWAIENIERFSDTDIFPKQVEHEVLYASKDALADELSATDIENLKPGNGRKFIVPKDDLSYRIGTQLSYLDNIILTAITREFGHLVENRRIPKADNAVFSYRFDPAPDFSLYDSTDSWNKFWRTAYSKRAKYDFFLLVDVSDFYNQIYHHTLENCLIEAGFPNQVKIWIMSLVESTTSKVSRGIPIGSHPVHLFAEAVLSNIDRSLLARGIDHARYVDDFVIFCKSEVEARRFNLIFADVLDKQGRLVVQRQKTRILNSSEFSIECSKNIEDRPINDLENKLVEIIKKHSFGDPYRIVLLSSLTPKELLQFKPETLNKILGEYLSEKPVDYIRLRWFLRRLSQVGHPGALTFVLDNIDRMLPALNDVFKYLLSVESADGEQWSEVGGSLLELSEDEITRDVPYYQLIVHSLFNQKSVLNHLGRLLSKFDKVPPEIQRELVILAFRNDCKDWIRELKERFPSFDIWTRNAFLVAISKLPTEERKFFIGNFVDKDDLSQKILAKWAQKQ